jgi:hypothetical protein
MMFQFHPSSRPTRRAPLLLLGFALAARFATAAAPAAVANPFESAAPLVARGSIDAATFSRWHELGIEPAAACSDAVFIRRVFLDLIGTLPTASETRAFLQDSAPDKRAAVIDRLLERPEYADYWAMKWGDVLRIKAEFPMNLWPNAAQAYHRWVYQAVRDNLPFDRFAHELLTASGSNFRVGPVNFYRAVPSREPEVIARAVALTFLGERAERWPEARLAGFAMCFRSVGYKATGEWKEEIVYFDPTRLPAGGRSAAILPDGTTQLISADRDPRAAFADWLATPANPWFARAAANRIWSWLLGRGIVHEPDDFRADNPPANPALLDAVTAEFVRAKFDVKHLIRVITNSQTYQLSSLAHSTAPAAEANFAFYAPRRIDAEVLIDALNAITGTSESYTSATPEPYTVMPDRQRAVALPDGSITSTFLEIFGRSARATGLACERNNGITAPQRLQLLNSTQMLRKLEQGPELAALFRGRQPREVIDQLYCAILSRPATAEERSTALAHATEQKLDARTAGLDLAWALINSAEFLHQH